MAINLQEEYNKTNIQGIIDQLEEDLVGLTKWLKIMFQDEEIHMLGHRERNFLKQGINLCFRSLRGFT